MKRKLLTAAALAAGPLLWASAANADEISLNAATRGGPVTFTAAGSDTLSFMLPAPGFAGSATYNGSTGTFLLGPMSGTTGAFGAPTPGFFTILSGGMETFNYAATPTGDGLTGTVTWPAIRDESSSPGFDLDAQLTVTNLLGTSSAAFKADFPVGSMAEIDFTVDL
jgi:hypothetical protein